MTAGLSPAAPPGEEEVYIFVPYSGYPRQLPSASGLPMALVVDATDPACFRRFWGMTLLERNLRQADRFGAAALHVLVRPEHRERAHRYRFPLTTTPIVHPVEGSPALAARDLVQGISGPVLLLEGAGVYDRRFIEALWQRPAPTMGTDRGRPLEALALLTDASTAALIPVGEDSGWQEVMPALSQHQAVHSLSLHTIEARISLLRRTVPPAVIRAADSPSLKRADTQMKQLAGKGINDLMGEFVHPPIEFFLTRIAALTPITPNQVSYSIILLSLAGLYFFAVGQLWMGIAVNLVRGVVDGVDGKLARLTLRESKGGNVLDHGTDTFYLPLLFAALGWTLSKGDPLSPPALSAYLLQILYWPNCLFASWFKSFLGVDESEFRRIDRLARRFHPKRNIFILMMTICMLFHCPQAGLYGITALTGLFVVFRIFRLDQEGRRLQGERAKHAS